MPLPKVSTPTFDTIVPTTGKAVKYRPFLSGDEKVLLMAMESRNQKEMISAIKQVIHNCVTGLGDGPLTVVDAEYLLLKLRAKSVGEVASPMVTCQHCEEGQDQVDINLDKIEPKTHDDHTNVIQLDDNVGITLRAPSVDMLEQYDLERSEAAIAEDVVIDCIVNVFDKDAVYPAEDHTRQELIEFMEGLGRDHALKIQHFFQTLPRVEHEVKWTCSSCNTENKYILRKIQDFFS